jgi:uncharacterized membrane protein
MSLENGRFSLWVLLREIIDDATVDILDCQKIALSSELRFRKYFVTGLLVDVPYIQYTRTLCMIVNSRFTHFGCCSIPTKICKIRLIFIENTNIIYVVFLKICGTRIITIATFGTYDSITKFKWQ